jgi:hypothetical protein
MPGMQWAFHFCSSSQITPLGYPNSREQFAIIPYLIIVFAVIFLNVPVVRLASMRSVPYPNAPLCIHIANFVLLWSMEDLTLLDDFVAVSIRI